MKNNELYKSCIHQVIQERERERERAMARIDMWVIKSYMPLVRRWSNSCAVPQHGSLDHRVSVE